MRQFTLSYNPSKNVVQKDVNAKLVVVLKVSLRQFNFRLEVYDTDDIGELARKFVSHIRYLRDVLVEDS